MMNAPSLASTRQGPGNLRRVMPVLHCYRYLPRSARDRLEMIVIGAWLDIEIDKDDLPRLMCRQCLNHHRALVDGGFHLFEYFFELRYCRTSDSCPECEMVRRWSPIFSLKRDESRPQEVRLQAARYAAPYPGHSQ